MATITVKFENQLLTDAGTVINIITTTDGGTHFVQNASCTEAGIAIQNYGVAMIPVSSSEKTYLLEAVKNNVHYFADKTTIDAASVGDNITMTDSLI